MENCGRLFPILWSAVALNLVLSAGAVGGDDGDGDDKEKEEEAERERQEAIREAEERRKEKHRKMEEEREKMRQEIRDKVSVCSACSHVCVWMYVCAHAWVGWTST